MKKLPVEVSKNIIAALERIQVRPYDYVQKLVGDDLYRLRVGKYRVILDILDDDLIILVIRAAHRKNVYDR